MDVVCLLELVDNALADIAEGSDIIGEYLYLYWHVQKPCPYRLFNFTAQENFLASSQGPDRESWR